MVYCNIEWSIFKKKIGSLLVRIVGKTSLRMKAINMVEFEKEIVELENSYLFKPLQKNQLQKLSTIVEVQEDSKELKA